MISKYVCTYVKTISRLFESISNYFKYVKYIDNNKFIFFIVRFFFRNFTFSLFFFFPFLRLILTVLGLKLVAILYYCYYFFFSFMMPPDNKFNVMIEKKLFITRCIDLWSRKFIDFWINIYFRSKKMYVQYITYYVYISINLDKFISY